MAYLIDGQHLALGDWVKPGAMAINVGINHILRDGQTRIAGDVRREEMSQAAAITPVPGGVGSMTMARLLENIVYAALRAQAA